MSALPSKALQEQLSAIMAALTTAAVAEICELVAEGYAELQLEISRKHRENEDLKKKLHLIESIVVRGGGGGGGGEEAGTGAAVVLREELPEVVLIKDEDSDSDGAFEEDHRGAADGGAADGGAAATREAVASAAARRSVKRRWPEHEEAVRRSSCEELTAKTSNVTAGTAKSSVAVHARVGPRSAPGCSGQFGGEEAEADSSQMYPMIHPSPNGQSSFGSLALIESLTSRAEMDLSLTWTKHSKGPTPFPQFQQSENADVEALGLKLVSVSGSTSADCLLSESSRSAFGYEDADATGFGLYGDPPGRPQAGPPGADGSGKRFVCSVCGKTYATPQNLDVHMRIHTGEKPFSCRQCGKKFTQSAHLKSHLSVHSGERPFACALCSRSFIVRYSLTLHMKKCHPAVTGSGGVL